MKQWEVLRKEYPQIEIAYNLHDLEAFKFAIILAYSLGKKDGIQETLKGRKINGTG